MLTKVLAVFGDEGAGKKSIVGSLIYKCGLDVQQLGRLEGSTGRKISEIVPFFDQNGIAKAFYAPSAQFVVEGMCSTDTATPDVAFWVVDASADVSTSSSASLLALLRSGDINPKEGLMVLVNKMDLVGWSEDAFKKSAKSFNDVQDHLPTKDVRIVPIAALQGTNVVESPDDVSWTESTLIHTI